MNNELDRDGMRAILKVRLNILFSMLDRSAQQGCEYAATRLRSQISGVLFLAEGLGLMTWDEKTAYEEDSFRRCYHSYPAGETREAAP